MVFTDAMPNRTYTVKLCGTIEEMAKDILHFPNDICQAWRYGNLLYFNVSFSDDANHHHQEIGAMVVEKETPGVITGVVFESLTITRGWMDEAGLIYATNAYLEFTWKGVPENYTWAELTTLLIC